MTEHKKEKVIEGKAVKSEKDYLQKGLDRVKNFDREANIHKIVGAVLLVIAAILLRNILIGLVCLTFGVLFITGFFENKRK